MFLMPSIPPLALSLSPGVIQPAQAAMLHKESGGSNGVVSETVALLDWAEERGVIKKSQHDALLKEFSRRLETRGLAQSQNSSRENLVAMGVKSIGGLGKRLKKRRRAEEEEHFLDFEFSSDEKGQFSKEDCVVS